MKIKFNFKSRRKRLVSQIESQDFVALVPASNEQVRNNDTHYPYRQSSDLYYLTGFDEANSLLLIQRKNKRVTTSLFCLAKDKTMEIWTGTRVGPERAVVKFGVDEAYGIGELDKKLPDYLNGVETVYYPISTDSWIEPKLNEAIKALKSGIRRGLMAPTTLKDVSPILHRLRLIKDKQEIKQMHQAAKVSAKAHVAAMKKARPGLFEYQLESSILQTFVEHGARYPAYESIVAGGVNACTLHYTKNNAELKNGDLVLIDAGAELDHYAADITRTFPVNGTFSPEQKAIYDIVLKAQKAAINMVRKGQPFNAYHDAAVDVIVDGLRKLKLLKGSKKNIMDRGTYKAVYMHRTGHWLGMDVHDVGPYKQDDNWIQLEPGMVLTVEPGIYIDMEADVDLKWRGIGIRIEDDVVVTEGEPLILSSDAPKEIDEIEKLMEK